MEKSSIVLTGKGQTLSFDLSGKVIGLYLVQVTTESGVQTAKVMVQK